MNVFTCINPALCITILLISVEIFPFQTILECKYHEGYDTCPFPFQDFTILEEKASTQ